MTNQTPIGNNNHHAQSSCVPIREFCTKIFQWYLRIDAKFSPHQVSDFQTSHVPSPPPPLRHVCFLFLGSCCGCGEVCAAVRPHAVALVPPCPKGGCRLSPPVRPSACSKSGSVPALCSPCVRRMYVLGALCARLPQVCAQKPVATPPPPKLFSVPAIVHPKVRLQTCPLPAEGDWVP